MRIIKIKKIIETKKIVTKIMKILENDMKITNIIQSNEIQLEL